MKADLLGSSRVSGGHWVLVAPALYGGAVLLLAPWLGRPWVSWTLLAIAAGEYLSVLSHMERASGSVILGQVFVALATVAGVVIYVTRSVGLVEGWWSEALETLRASSWSEMGVYASFATYLFWRLLLFLILAVVLARLRGMAPWRLGYLAGAFLAGAGSAMACDYSLWRPLSRVGVFRLEQGRPFVLAAGILGLEYPLLLFIVALAAVGVSNFIANTRGSRGG
ncbi:MAG TPA: hypothetical protein VKA53_08780 [Thermoanaerobaculia bacterium]|nr:hypothetical protein [Thermoanaerobaculia bacterium]